MITEHQVSEDNKTLLLQFRQYLTDQYEEEQLVDEYMADVSLYALDYSSECLHGNSVANINVFDVHCFLADYMIRHTASCSADDVSEMLDSLAVFADFLERARVISAVDLEEILALCENPSPYIARLAEYQRLLSAHDVIGLQRWQESVLDAFDN